MCLMKRIQKVQNAAAGFVFGRHATVIDVNDVINLSWLIVVERHEHAIAVLAFKALNVTTFKHEAKRIINNLPRSTRDWLDLRC